VNRKIPERFNIGFSEFFSRKPQKIPGNRRNTKMHLALEKPDSPSLYAVSQTSGQVLTILNVGTSGAGKKKK
jgi:hypothetical protein